LHNVVFFTESVVVARVFLAEEALLQELVAVWDQVPMRLVGAWVVHLLGVEWLQEQCFAHTGGGLLHALPLFADFLGEEEVLEGELQEDVLEEVEALDLEGGGGGAAYQESGRGHQVAWALFQKRETTLNEEISRGCSHFQGACGFDLQNSSAKSLGRDETAWRSWVATCTMLGLSSYKPSEFQAEKQVSRLRRRVT
jgi:hypothetical protein